MSYMLYKEAAGDGDTRKRALMQVLGALGGGAAGYLLTRYGLGIKGSGAGMVGTGMGAALGALGGNYMADYGKEQEQVSAKTEERVKELENLVQEPVSETFRRELKDPWQVGAGLGLGAAMAARNAPIKKDIAKMVKSIAGELQGATNAAQAKALGQKYRGRITSGMANDIRALIRKNTGNRSSQHAIDALAAATSRQGGKYAGDALTTAILRLKRFGKWGAAGAIGLPLLSTTVERKVMNPRRSQALNTLGAQ